jgi:hypothetical protein
MEWDFIQSSNGSVSTVNLKTFDIVMNPGFGMASMTIFPSRQKRRKEKIKKIFKLKKPLN